MTEKQYRLNKWGTRLLKNNRPLFDWFNDSDEIVDLLNELNDENKELKEELEHIQDSLWTTEYIKNIEGENKELRRLVSNLNKQNKELIEEVNDLKFENEKKYRTIMQLEQMLQDVER